VGRNGAGKSTLVKAIIGKSSPIPAASTCPPIAPWLYRAGSPTGTATPFETVLAADTERAALLEEAETSTDPHRLGDVHDRLIAIDAYTASRARRILLGLGFTEEMRAPARFLFGRLEDARGAGLAAVRTPMLLLDEPSNHLDLEATLWLENFLRSYPGTLILISHERDLLNNVVGHILHLQGGKLTLYAGGYDSFERQRAERAAQAAAKAAQDAQRAKLEDYVRRNSARASTAKQAHRRQDAGQDAAGAGDDEDPRSGLSRPHRTAPPLITTARRWAMATRPILRHINLRIDPDDRIAPGPQRQRQDHAGRLLAGQLPAMEGQMVTAGKLNIGYFTQYQVEELAGADTPLVHMARAMQGKPESAARAAWPLRLFRPQATTAASQLAASARAWRWRW
jgi:ATP-binding cassette subfamily F protein 3